MTAPVPDVLAEMVALAARIRENIPEPRTLHVGPAIMAWVRTLPRPKPYEEMFSIAPFFNTPVRLDVALEDGQWQLRDLDGATVQEGRVGELGQIVHFVPGAEKFVCFDREAVGEWL